MQKKPYRIAFVIPSLDIAGAENMLLNIANGLVNKGYDIHILFLKETGGLLPLLDHRVTRWNLDNGRVYFSLFRVRKLIRKIKPDVFFPWMGYLNAYYIFFKPLFSREMKWICRESTIPSMGNAIYRFPALYNYLYRFYNRYDRVVCQSAFMADDLRTHFNVRPEKLVIINNPVDPKKCQPVPGDPETGISIQPGMKQLLYVGGLNHWKRVELLFEALALLPPHYRLTLVVNTEVDPGLYRRVKEMKLFDRVQWINGITNPYPFYQAAGCLLLCSAFEGFPNVALEALANGCPVVGYDIKGGANEILANYGGFIVPGGTIADFAATISRVCEKEILDRSKIREACLEKYSLDTAIGLYEMLLQKVAGLQNHDQHANDK